MIKIIAALDFRDNKNFIPWVNVGDRYVFSHPSSGDWILINGLEEADLCARPNNKRKKVIVVL